jgi:uncharacterized membrane protein YtjA (UPF0391 family)
MAASLARFKPAKDSSMFSWAVTILILAVVAALLSFGGFAGMSGWLMKGLCLLLILLCIVAALFA